jgi:uncharacterized protein (TIGR02284 family)
MVTFVGKEKDTANLLNNLLELDYDAIEAYEAAIARLDNAQDKQMMTAFMIDHQRHVAELTAMIETIGGTPVSKGDIKRVLTKGKVVLGGLIGDSAILLAMKTNEEDTNTAYRRASEQKLPSPIGDLIEKNYADEVRHRAWIMARLGSPQSVPQT